MTTCKLAKVFESKFYIYIYIFFKINNFIDIDECQTGTDDCNRKSQNCLNTRGNFTCIDKVSKMNCPPGFKMDTKSDECVDINECEENKEICGDNKKCVNEAGRYACEPLATPTTGVPSTTTTKPPISKTTVKTTTKKDPDISPTSDNEISSFVPPVSKPTILPTYKSSIGKKPTTNPSSTYPKNKLNCPRGYTLLSNQCVGNLLIQYLFNLYYAFAI